MAGHEPQKVARLIEAQKEFTDEAKELLEFLGTLEGSVYYDVGVDKILVVLPGWSVLKDPADYLVLSVKSSA